MKKEEEGLAGKRHQLDLSVIALEVWLKLEGIGHEGRLMLGFWRKAFAWESTRGAA